MSENGKRHSRAESWRARVAHRWRELPRWRRTIIVLLALVYLVGPFIADAVQKHRIRMRIEAIAARGEPTTLEELVPPPIPAECNAASLLEGALAELRRVGRVERVQLVADFRRTGETTNPRDTAWAAFHPGMAPEAIEQHEAEFRAILSDYALALDLADGALALPDCRFTLDTARGIEAEFDAIAGLEDLAYVISLRATLNARDGRCAAALEDCRHLLRLSSCLAEESVLLLYLRRRSINELSLRTVEAMLGADGCAGVDPSQLGSMLADEAAAYDLADALRAERVTEVHALSKAIRTDRQLRWDPKIGAAFRQGEIVLLDQFEHLIAALSLPYNNAKAEVEQLRADAQDLPSWAFVAEIVMPSLLFTVDRQAEIQARLRTAAVGCLLADAARAGAEVDPAFRSLPEHVRVDPYTDKDLRLTRTDTELLVYSLGPNQHDDCGVHDAANRTRDPNVKDDIAFRIPLRTNGEVPSRTGG